MSKGKRAAVLERIERIEDAIAKAQEYLETGAHAHWHGFRPIFGDEKDRPPHRDWVENVFLTRKQRALARAEKLLDRLSDD